MKMKKATLRIMAVLGLLVLLMVPGAATTADAPTTVSISAPASVNAGNSFNVTVSIANVANFDTAQYDITYDSTVIEVINPAPASAGGDIYPGNINGTTVPVDASDSVGTGRIRVINNIPGTPGVNGSGSLTVIRFKAVGSANHSSAINFSTSDNSCILGDNAAHQITVTSWTGATVTLSSALGADFTGSPTEVVVNQAVTFTATATGGSGTKSYAWDFDNNGTTDNTTSSNVITHKYASALTYSVKLVVSDDSGSYTVTKTGYIKVDPALTADFSGSPLEVVVNQAVTFTATASGGFGTRSYAWDFDNNGSTDNTTSSNVITHKYAADNTYSVKLTVTDSSGSLIVTKTSYIKVDPALTADFSGSPLEVTVNQAVTFTATATGGFGTKSYAWDFNNDGTTDNTTSSNVITHKYGSAQTYSVKLTVTDSSGSLIVTKTGYIKVDPTLTADFSGSPTEVVVNQAITFTATASGGFGTKSYAWDFDNNGSTDNTTSSNVITHKYASANTYTVKLTVTDSSGSLIVTKTSYITVYGSLSVGSSANVTEAMVGKLIGFSATVSGGKPGYTYDWNFGDGTAHGTGATASHGYGTAGTKTVTLTVTDALGNSGTHDVTVTIYPTLSAVSSYDTDEVAVGEVLGFQSAVSGGKPGYTYDWNFGDASAHSTSANTTHPYATPGLYTATLTVKDALNDAVVQTMSVHVYARGDANGDGSVNALDITYDENVIMGIPGYYATTWADANSDGLVNVLDLTAQEITIVK